MNPNAKRYFWSATAAAVVYVLGVAVMNHELHPAAGAKNLLAVFIFPLCPAAFISAAINLKLMRPCLKKYFWRFSAGMGAYALGLDLANHIYTPQTPWRYWLILLPVLPLIYIAFVIIRYIADSDEMWRKIYMEAWAFSGVATGFTCFSYLFFRDSGAPEFHAEWAYYLMWTYYGIGLFFSWRRYK